MMEAQHILKKILLKWRVYRFMEIAFLALSFAMITYLLSVSLVIALSTFVVAGLIGTLYYQPWNYGLTDICSHLDASLGVLENSASLLLRPEEELTLLAKIQQSKIAQTLKSNKKSIYIKNRVGLAALITLCCLGLVTFCYFTGALENPKTQTPQTKQKDAIVITALDTATVAIVPPKINKQVIIIDYPEYTNKRRLVTSDMNIKALEGSTVKWRIDYNQKIKESWLQFGTDNVSMSKRNTSYVALRNAENSRFYNLKFLDTLENRYISDLYALEVYKDEAPSINITGLQPFTSFDFAEPQLLEFTAHVKDDFGLAEVAIIATVSKGTGESVKFREERLSFDNFFKKASTSSSLKKKLDLRTLKMEPGDELYFYVEATDIKSPKPNSTRTETFFSVIRDTVKDGFAVEGTMGADLMPDYFRSQRQLIIDTEKLIADESKLEKKEYNFKSNELGFDQKALRLKYGKFMGDETEGPVAPTTNTMADTDSEDPLASYSHKHDSDNEHNLVAEEEHDHEHDHEESQDQEEDPLEAYVHNHEDPEASTLFAQSLKSKLKQAMAEMWDAELYLRLFEPEKSLPYQHKALKLIQEIKNSARIYVHRIGFDPPPIKESKRLSGELGEVKSSSKQADLEKEFPYIFMNRAIERLELLRTTKVSLQPSDREIFQKAGEELARLAIKEPSKYLNTLQGLKLLSEAENSNEEDLKAIQKGLVQALPNLSAEPIKGDSYSSRLNKLMLDALENNE
jgi:hypothetical protein